MKKSTRIRPVLESLESMMLLSTATVDIHALAKKAPVVVAPVPTVDLHLQGTLHGTGTVRGTSASVGGSGNLAPVGSTSFRLNNINLNNPPTTVTLATRKGNLYLASTTPIIGAGSTGSTTYNVIGGTKTYAHATGTGTVAASYTLVKGKLTTTINFA